MNEQGIIIPNLALAGYRSFGKEPQYFDQFAKINLFIGQNNAGKSNVLRFLSEIYPQMCSVISQKYSLEELSLNALDRHHPDRLLVQCGIGERADIDELPPTHRWIFNINHSDNKKSAARYFAKILREKAKIDGTDMCWVIFNDYDGVNIKDTWLPALQELSYEEINELLSILNGNDQVVYDQGYEDDGLKKILESELIKKMSIDLIKIKAKLIPAIRRIGEKGSSSDSEKGSSFDAFDGTGIIDRLAKLQHPSNLSSYQEEKKLFENIQSFLREVINRPDAILEIPEEKHTIHVDMDGRVLPIESLGTGIHEVVILATAATVLSEHVVCIEEPELHLNPILQRKLIRYLSEHTNNQYFITTHSAVLMDVPGAEIYHIKLVDGASVVKWVTSDRQKSDVCEDLGYHPSDLVQANCIIWVEGPSDRIYLNWWLKSMASDLVEGIQYSIMFYGGRLLSHLSNDDVEETDVNDFISLRKLNNRSVMLIDSDEENEDSDINATKSRLRDEFNSGPGHAWITAGREIENYLSAAWIEAAIKAIHPQAKKIGPFEKYDNTLKITGGKGKETQADKVKVARHITEQSQLDLSMYDLKAQLNKLIKFIRESNPAPASSEKKQQLPVSP